MIKRRCLSPKSPASMRCPELHRKNLLSTDCWLFLASYRTVVVASPFFLAKLGGCGRYSKHFLNDICLFLKAFPWRKNKIGRINSVMNWIYHNSSLILLLLQAMEQGTEMAAKQAVKRLNSVSAKSSPFPEAKKTR